MRPELLVNQARRYLTRISAKPQAVKVALATLLGFIVVAQLFKSSSPTIKKISIVKPGETSNENYKSLGNDIIDLSFGERCSKFFEYIEEKDSTDEEFDTISSSSQSFKPVTTLHDFIEQAKKAVGDKYREEMVEEWKKAYNNFASNSQSRIQRYLTFFSNVRIYGTCYIDTGIFEELTGSSSFNLLWNDEVTSQLDESNLFHLSNEFGLRYFSWVSGIRPVYKKMGSTTAEVGVPQIEPSYEAETVGKASFLYNFKQSLNGRGLVIPVLDKEDLNNLKRLAKVLRFIGNTLPVQIVHNGFLDGPMEESIKDAFVSEIVHSDFISWEDSKILPLGFDANFSPFEEVWFVNIAQTMSNKYSGKLNDGVILKSLALIFSSFGQGILIDPKVIPLRQLLELMDTVAFEMTGSYYFPDLLIDEDITPGELEFFKKLMPTDVDEEVFGIGRFFEAEFDRLLSKGKTHVINNDVVALDKKVHFVGLLLAVELQLSPIVFEHKSMLKDLLFIGPTSVHSDRMVISETEAAIVGEFTPEENRKVKQSVSKEICSQHIGYFKDDSLVFFTNGCRNCDAMDELDLEKEKDQALYRTLEKDTDKLRQWGGKAAKFEGAIIPLPQEVVVKNNIDEIDTSLKNYGYCGDSIWCAYDILGAKKDDIYHGKVIEFDDSTKQVLKLVSDVWMKF